MLLYEDCKLIQNIDKPTGRVYDTPAGTFPSITTMLGKTSDKTWLNLWKAKVGEEEAERIKNAAAERGTILHDYLESLYNEYNSPTIDQVRRFLKQKGIDKEKPFVQKMIKELIKHLLANNFISVSQEFVVWDEELELAGRCDGLGYWNDTLIIIDYKTARKTKTRTFIKDYFLQATFYTVAHNKMFSDKVNKFIILIAVEDGTTQVFTGSPVHHYNELVRRREAFSGLVN